MYPTIYVVTSGELGWDCIVAAFDNKEAAESLASTNDDYMVLTTPLKSKFFQEEYL